MHTLAGLKDELQENLTQKKEQVSEESDDERLYYKLVPQKYKSFWNHFHLFNISHFSSLCCAQNFILTSCTKTMAKRMQEQEGDNRIVGKPLAGETAESSSAFQKSQKNKDATMDHFFAMSPQTISYSEAVYHMVRKIYGRPSNDPMKELNVNVAIWGFS